MSATEKRLTRRLLVRVARYEMLEARADGRLKRRIPIAAAVKEVERALRERRKLTKALAGMNALQRTVAEAQAVLNDKPSPSEPLILGAPSE